MNNLLNALEPACETPKPLWTLRLYVAGQNSKSLKARTNAQTLCDTHLAGRYELEIVDLKETPEYAARDSIVVIPTLVRLVPIPVRKIFGDLSKMEQVLEGLDIAPLAA